jgi:hypothetical protein
MLTPTNRYGLPPSLKPVPSAVTKPRTSARGKTCGRGTNAQAVSAAAHARAGRTAAKARPRNGAAGDSRDWKVGRASIAVALPPGRTVTRSRCVPSAGRSADR